jgi:hypothetical protein
MQDFFIILMTNEADFFLTKHAFWNVCKGSSVFHMLKGKNMLDKIQISHEACARFKVIDS